MNAPETPFRFDAAIAAAADRAEAKVVAWRRDLHEHPELGNREVRTSGIVAAHLRALGLDEVREKVGGARAWSACCAAASPAPWWRCAPTWTRCP